MEEQRACFLSMSESAFPTYLRWPCKFFSSLFFVQGMFSVQTAVNWPYHFVVVVLSSLICFAIIGSFVFSWPNVCFISFLKISHFSLILIFYLLFSFTTAAQRIHSVLGFSRWFCERPVHSTPLRWMWSWQYISYKKLQCIKPLLTMCRCQYVNVNNPAHSAVCGVLIKCCSLVDRKSVV